MVAAGTLRGDASSVQGEVLVVDPAALVFDQSTDATFNGTLVGAGTLTKTGNGTLRLAGAHPLQGRTFVDAGTLVLDGSLGGAVEVGSAGTFDAVGAIGGSLTVAGTVAVMSSESGGPGTLTVDGDMLLMEGSRYRAALDAAGDSTLLVARGAVTMASPTVLVDPRAGEYGRVTHYPVLYAAGGLTTTATAASTAATLEPWLTRVPTTLFVTLLNTELPLEPFATTANGARVAHVIDRLGPLRSGETGDLARVTRELTALDDPGLAAALDAVSGEIHASAVQLAALDAEAVTDVVRGELAERSISSGPARPGSPWTARRSGACAAGRGGVYKGSASPSTTTACTAPRRGSTASYSGRTGGWPIAGWPGAGRATQPASSRSTVCPRRAISRRHARSVMWATPRADGPRTSASASRRLPTTRAGPSGSRREHRRSSGPTRSSAASTG